MFRQIGAPEIILILLVLILLFGAKKLPDLSRSIGRSLRIFKSEVKDLGGDDDKHTTPATTRPREVEGRVVDSTGSGSTEHTRVPEAEHDR